jgi:hypothetical protein
MRSFTSKLSFPFKKPPHTNTIKAYVSQIEVIHTNYLTEGSPYYAPI